jgi:hypothetical protein
MKDEDDSNLMEDGQENGPEMDMPNKNDTIGDHRLVFSDLYFHPIYAPKTKPLLWIIDDWLFG